MRHMRGFRFNVIAEDYLFKLLSKIVMDAILKIRSLSLPIFSGYAFYQTASNASRAPAVFHSDALVVTAVDGAFL